MMVELDAQFPGYGWASTGWVGMGLSLGGFVIFLIAWLTGRARTTA